eukprot:EG_transcript_8874
MAHISPTPHLLPAPARRSHRCLNASMAPPYAPKRYFSLAVSLWHCRFPGVLCTACPTLHDARAPAQLLTGVPHSLCCLCTSHDTPRTHLHPHLTTPDHTHTHTQMFETYPRAHRRHGGVQAPALAVCYGHPYRCHTRTAAVPFPPTLSARRTAPRFDDGNVWRPLVPLSKAEPLLLPTSSQLQCWTPRPRGRPVPCRLPPLQHLDRSRQKGRPPARPSPQTQGGPPFPEPLHLLIDVASLGTPRCVYVTDTEAVAVAPPSPQSASPTPPQKSEDRPPPQPPAPEPGPAPPLTCHHWPPFNPNPPQRPPPGSAA